MLTPRFNVSQTDEFVILVLKCPFIKAQDVEFFIDDCEFKFYVAPYYLRLHFPHPIVEDGRESAKYDVGKGEITVQLPKAVKGTEFEDLDLLTKLLMPNKNSSKATAAKAAGRALIEEVESNKDAAVDMDVDQTNEDQDEDFDEDFQWDLPQELAEEDNSLTGAKYGFNDSYSGFAAQIIELGRDVCEISDLDTSTKQSRRQQRIQKEDEKFDEEYYLSDIANPEEIQRLLRFKPESWSALKRIQASKTDSKANGDIIENMIAPTTDSSVPQTLNMISSSFSNILDAANMDTEDTSKSSEPSITAPVPMENIVQNTTTSVLKDKWLMFSEKEQEQLINLPKKQLLVSPENCKSLLCGIVDILFAYCYDHRTTEGDPTVESSWTITKLSSTLSSFETFSTLRETLIASFRRSLAYPLYRNFDLSKKVLEDVVVLLKLGKRAILKSFLSIRRLLRGDDGCYIFDSLYIEDYCIWIQSVRAQMAHLVLYHLATSNPERKFFRWSEDLCAFIDKHWNYLSGGRERTATWQNTVASALSTHSKDVFVSGSEHMSGPGWWGLRELKPPENPKAVVHNPPPSKGKRKRGAKAKEESALGEGKEGVSKRRQSVRNGADGVDAKSENEIKDVLGSKPENVAEELLQDEKVSLKEESMDFDKSGPSVEDTKPEIPEFLTSSDSFRLLKKLDSKPHLSCAESRLRRRLLLRRIKKCYNCPIFDLDQRLREYIDNSKSTVTAMPLLQTMKLFKLSDDAKAVRIYPNGFADRSIVNRYRQAMRNVKPNTDNRPIHWATVGHPLLTDSLAPPGPFVSKFTGRTLSPHIWRSFGVTTPAMEILKSIVGRRSLTQAPGKTDSIDYVNFDEMHLSQVNQMLSRQFWPGIDVSESLQFPDYSIVALYKRLVVGCAFMTPEGYITYIMVRPGWERGGIGRFMLYYLLQALPSRDITLHVSANNPSMFWLQDRRVHFELL
ncbi:Hsp90 cochaperone shq1 [Chytridiales sp. JEL 0842]|nr:Hsp90 cochaperone shq1 [Chytridiales sp. JEL 0842]